MNAGELRRLTAEWVKQPKTQAYLNFILNRNTPFFTKNQKNHSTLPNTMGKVEAELSFKRFVIEHSMPLNPKAMHAFEEGRGSTDTTSFFPHRLSFLSYWLLGFAAVTASVLSSAPTTTAKPSTIVCNKDVVDNTNIWEAFLKQDGFTEGEISPVTAWWETYDQALVRGMPTDTSTWYLMNQVDWNSAWYRILLAKDCPIQGSGQKNSSMLPPEWFSLTQTTPTFNKLPAKAEVAGWSNEEPLFQKVPISHAEQETYSAPHLEKSFSLPTDLTGDKRLQKASLLLPKSLAMDVAESLTKDDRLETGSLWAVRPVKTTESNDALRFMGTDKMNTSLQENSLKRTAFAKNKQAWTPEILGQENPTFDYRVAARGLDLWRQKLALQHPSLSELSLTSAAVKANTMSGHSTANLIAFLPDVTENSKTYAKEESGLAEKKNNNQHQTLSQSKQVLMGRAAGIKSLDMVQNVLPSSRSLRLVHPLCISDMSYVENVPVSTKEPNPTKKSIMSSESSTASMSIWPSMRPSASSILGQRKGYESFLRNMLDINFDCNFVAEEEETEPSLKENNSAFAKKQASPSQSWKVLQKWKQAVRRFYKDWLTHRVERLDQLSLPADLFSDFTSLSPEMKGWRTIHPDRRRAEKLFRAAFDNSPSGLRRITPTIERVRQHLRNPVSLTRMHAFYAKDSNLNGDIVLPKTYGLHWTPRNWLNHRHILSVRRPVLRALQNRTDSQRGEILPEGCETHLNTLNRLVTRRLEQSDHRISKDGLHRPQRKRWQPRPAWLETHHLRAFWATRQSVNKAVLKQSTSLASSTPKKMANIRLVDSQNRLYGNALRWSTRLNSTLLSERLPSDQVPFLASQEAWGLVNVSHSGLSPQTLKALRRNARVANQLKGPVQRYVKRVNRSLNQLYASQRRSQFWAFRRWISSWNPLTLNERWGLLQTENPDCYVTFRGAFQDVGDSTTAVSTRNWLKAVHRSEYHRLVYERIQAHIRHMFETGGYPEGNVSVSGKLRKTVTKMGRMPSGTTDKKSIPVNARHVGPTLQRAWALRREQERSVYMFLLRQDQEAVDALKAQQPRVVNAHTQTWLHTRTRSLRKVSPWLRKSYQWRQAWIWDRQQPWRAKLVRARTRLDRLTRRVDTGRTFTRYVGPTVSFWWEQIPGWQWHWTQSSFPTVQWSAWQAGSFAEPMPSAWMEFGLFMFHTCALFSLSAFPAVRGLFKFYAILGYKMVQVYAEAWDRLYGFISAEALAKNALGLSSEKKRGAVQTNNSLFAKQHRLWGGWVYQLLWYGNLQNQLLLPRSGSVEGLTDDVQKRVMFGPSLATWNQPSYWKSVVKLIALDLSRQPSTWAMRAVLTPQRLAWQAINRGLVTMEQVNRWLNWFFIDPVPVTLDFIAYAFFVPWTADLSTWVPEQLDTRLALTGRKQSRATILWTSIAFGWSGTLLGSWLQRRVWSMAENWWAIAHQPDEDLLRRQRNHQLRLEVWTELLMQAADAYGISLTALATDVDEQQRLVELLWADPDWTWFDPTRLPPQVRQPLQKEQEIPVTDTFWRRWGSQPQLTHPLLHLETWMDAPPATMLQTLPTGDALPGAGELICDVFAGLWQRRIARNILVIGPDGPSKNLWVKALAGEMEVPLIQDSARRYTDKLNGIRRLKEVFDAVAWQAPCLFLLEDIHVIGHRRSESLASTGVPQVDTRMILGEAPDPDHVQDHNVHVFTRHALTHYGRPFRGDFSEHIGAHHFAFDLFSNPSTSLRRRLALSVESPLPLDQLEGDKRAKMGEATPQEGSAKGSTEMAAPTNVSRLKIIRPTPLKPPAASALNLLALRAERTVQPLQVVPNWPLTDLSQEQQHNMTRARNVIRSKVATLAQQTLAPVSSESDALTDLLLILDNVRSQRGFVVFATTHAAHVLDPALRRPGRLDQTIHIGTAETRWSTGSILQANQPQQPSRASSAVNKGSKILSAPGFAGEAGRMPVWLESVLRSKEPSSFVNSSGSVPNSVKEMPNLQEGSAKSDSNAIHFGKGATLQNGYVNQISAPQRDRLKSLAYGQIAEQWMNWQIPTAPMANGQAQYAWLYGSPQFIPAEVIPALAVHLGEGLVMSQTGRQASIRLVHWSDPLVRKPFQRTGDSSEMMQKDPSSALHKVLASWMDKRGLYAPNMRNTRLWHLQNQESLLDPPSPPLTELTVPAKRYEHYRRIERDFQMFHGAGRVNWREKLDMHQSVRVGERLYGKRGKTWFRSETEDSFIANQPNKNTLQSPNVSSFPEVKEGKDRMGKTSFTSAFWQLSNLPPNAGSRSAIQRYVDARLVERHLTYLTNQWWNAHLAEQRAEDTFLSDVDHRIQFVIPVNADMYVDFPDAEQYYNPRQRRWMLHDESWQYPDRWVMQERSHFYEHMILECTARGYAWLDERREAVDVLAWTVLKQGTVQEVHLAYAYQRF